MADSKGAGPRRFRIAFDQRVPDDIDPEGAGLKPGDWQEQFIRHCGILYLRGGETVIADRLSGVVPAVLTVPVDTQTRRIDTSWRARQIDGPVFNIRSLPPPDGKPLTIDILCDAGPVDA